ncbi:MAG: EAL domain-containing protein, partial [Pseudorhodoferax sp.]
FDPGLQAAVTARAALESDLRQALARNELALHYQPQVDDQGRVTGFEALVRWAHRQRGQILPGEFIPLAEDTGLILQLGRWVLREACFQLARWSARPETAGLTMAVNVSSWQFRHPDFVAQCASVLARTRADGRRLKLELTESLMVEDMETTASKMEALKAHGIGFSLDDFGTGYSSLSYLRRLPLDQLKIDQSFVREAGRDANDSAIVRTIIGLASSLGLQVIAEGVETPAQRDFLLHEGCRAFQGYLFGRPMPAAALDGYLASALAPTGQP